MLQVKLSGNNATIKIIAFDKDEFLDDLTRIKNDIPATYRKYDSNSRSFIVRDIDQLQHIPYIQSAVLDRDMQLSFSF